MGSCARTVDNRPASPQRRLVGLTVLALLVAAVGLIGGAGSANGTVAAATGATSTLPPPPPNGDYGAYVNGKQTVTKAKTTIEIPTELLRLYLFPSQVGNATITDAQAWVLSPKGVPQRFGYFQPIHTSVLAFGSIPVTATVQLRQVVAGTKIEPLLVHGRSVFDPATGSFTTYPVTVRGRLELQISDVAVDGVPLQVGPDCHTSTPVSIAVAGFFPGYSVFTGGPLTGSALIPPFAGCGTATENLSPLLTSAIAGPNNPLSMKQGFLQQWSPPESCPLCPLP